MILLTPVSLRSVCPSPLTAREPGGEGAVYRHTPKPAGQAAPQRAGHRNRGMNL